MRWLRNPSSLSRPLRYPDCKPRRPARPRPAFYAGAVTPFASPGLPHYRQTRKGRASPSKVVASHLIPGLPAASLPWTASADHKPRSTPLETGQAVMSFASLVTAKSVQSRKGHASLAGKRLGLRLLIPALSRALQFSDCKNRAVWQSPRQGL